MRSPHRLLTRLGLGRRELVGWSLYDWANSGFYTVIVASVYPIFFAAHAVGADVPSGVASGRHALATFWSLLAVALMAPFLGALADTGGTKKRFLAIFLGLGVTATAGLFFVGPGEWILSSALFVVANIGVVGSVVFYDSLLPHIADDDEIDRVSAAGFACGYLGGGLLLAAGVLLIARHEWLGLDDQFEAMKWLFLAVAVWWTLFSIPVFRWVPEPEARLEADESPVTSAVTRGLQRLVETFGELRSYRQAFVLLVAVMVYSDGIGTIIRMGTIYGEELGLPHTALVGAVLLIQFLGVPFALLFGALGDRIGAKRAILLGLGVYVGISVFAYFIDSASDFYLLAALVGMVMGGTQALSRSLFASLVPRHKSSEFFGFFAIFEKFAGVLGPLAFAVVVSATGSSRQAILAVIAFFVVGAALLLVVDVEAGRRAARAAAPASTRRWAQGAGR